ncbi:hypothetical protein D8771_04975 [Streptomyces albus]|uniref:Uncharacterized protein n=1 Tax=Streptomyces albus TaxID=1888 RepID=A0A8H1QUW9_9ACTN|nr:hypothetical protein D8771_04975 [Streptomyces albus]
MPLPSSASQRNRYATKSLCCPWRGAGRPAEGVGGAGEAGSAGKEAVGRGRAGLPPSPTRPPEGRLRTQRAPSAQRVRPRRRLGRAVRTEAVIATRP